VIPGMNSTEVLVAKDLKPVNSTRFRNILPPQQQEMEHFTTSGTTSTGTSTFQNRVFSTLFKADFKIANNYAFFNIAISFLNYKNI
jgi:hypothetical protein